jgi:hypothetical protein
LVGSPLSIQNQSLNLHRTARISAAVFEEAVFDFYNGVELRESQGMKLSDIAKAEATATGYKQLMIKKWHEPLDR